MKKILQGEFQLINILLILLLSIGSIMLFAETPNYNIGLKYFGLSLHPFGAYNNEKLMPLKFDDKGLFVLDVGFMASFEKYLWKDFVSIKFVQSIYGDCILQPAGFTHLGFRLKIFSIGKHQLNGGIGPTLIYRKNWYDVEGYDDSYSFFEGSKDDFWQWRFLWYGGEFEYNYNVYKNIDLSVTFIPGFPDLLAFAFGVRAKF